MATDKNEPFIEAEFAGIWGENGLPPFFSRSTKLPIPSHVNVEADVLFYEFNDPPSRKRPDTNLLKAFTDLSDGKGIETDALLTFTKRYGVIAFCEAHGLPFEHADRDGTMLRRKIRPEGYYQFPCGCDILRPTNLRDTNSTYSGKNPVELWLPWIKSARAMISIRAALETSELTNIPISTWREAALTGYWDIARKHITRRSDGPDNVVSLSLDVSDKLRSAPKKLGRASKIFRAILNNWLWVSGVRPIVLSRKVQETQRRREIVLGSYGLIGAIAIQLVSACLFSGGKHAICSHCGDVVTGMERLRTGKFGFHCHKQECRNALRAKQKRSQRMSLS